MPKITILVGLPASGKSTWAKKAVRSISRTKRVNKDDLRSMTDDGEWSKENERQILVVRDAIIAEHLRNGYNVILDDTNLHLSHHDRMAEIAQAVSAETGAAIEVDTKFFETSLDECIARDAARTGKAHVGEAVIRRHYKDLRKFLGIGHEGDLRAARMPMYEEQTEGLPEAIIVDLDGTTSVINGRNPFDVMKCGSDLPNMPVVDLIRRYHDLGVKVILLSGRDGSAWDETVDWLGRHDVPYTWLIMRTAGDQRKDSVIKRELFEQYIRGFYKILFVLDDRDQVVDLWRKDLGLPCFQVFYGNF